MNRKRVIGAFALAGVALFSKAVFGQQQSNPPQEKSGQMRPGMTGGGKMMGGGMMMGQMMAQHQQMSQLMNKMMESMAAVENEKDPDKLKALLAEHAALMDQMHTGMMSQRNMMRNMAGQVKECAGMGESGKPASR